MLQKKIAMLGMFGVGKTSLVRRFVSSIFDEKYHTTLGVKVDKKMVDVDGDTVNLMLWDIAGAEEKFCVPMHYVKGAAGYLLVLDGTRPASLDHALEIVERIEGEIGELPFITVINKNDLERELSDEAVAEKLAAKSTIMTSSAKTGENVEDAFALLARKMLGR